MPAQFEASLSPPIAPDTMVLDPPRASPGAAALSNPAGIDPVMMVAAFESSPNGVLLLDPDGAVIWANRRFTSMWGLPPSSAAPGERWLPQSLTSRIANPGEFAARLRRLDHHRHDEEHGEVVLADGGVIEFHTAPIIVAEHRLRGRVWFSRDVTQQRRAETQLREEEEKFRSVVEQDIAGVCIIGHDRRVVYANAVYAGMFGYTPAQLIGRPLVDIVPENEKGYIAALLGRHLSGEKSVVRIASTVKAMDGHVVDVLVHATGGTYRGRPASIAVVVDISEQQQAKRELEFAEIIVEQSPIVLFRTLASGNFPTTYVSRNVTRFGFDSAAVTAEGFRFRDHVYAPDRPRVLAGLHALMDGATDEFTTDYRLVTRDGHIRWVQSRTVAIHDESGVVTALQGTLVDITDRKQAEQSLERVNRALRTLSAGNEVVVRARSEQELLDEMCRCLVEAGRYPYCWIGFADSQEPPAVTPMAYCGCSPGMIDEPDMTAASDALRSMQPAVVRTAEAVLDHGFTACTALPFTLGPDERGVLVLYAAADDSFDDDAVKLLS